MLWLDNARIAATVAVVLLHVAANVVRGAGIGTEYWWFGNIYDSSVRWCVPVFVMISGALLLDPAKTASLSHYYRKRASRILIPLVFWSLLYLVWRLAWGAFSGDMPTGSSLLAALVTGKPYYHMWFLYMLPGLYLLAPFLAKIASRSSTRELGLLIAASLTLAAAHSLSSVGHQLDRDPFPLWFLPYVPYFVLGVVMGRVADNPNIAVALCVYVLSVAATAYACHVAADAAGLEAGLYFYDYLSPTVILMSVAMIWMLRGWHRPAIVSHNLTKAVASLTFGVYLVHPMVLAIVRQVVNPLSFHPAISIPLLAAIVFMASLLVAWMISRVPLLSRTI